MQDRRFGWSLGALLAVLFCGPSHADSVTYYYDQLGRVIEAVNATTSQATLYSYDAAGNITSTNVAATTAIAISGFTPNQGSVGTQVTIYGAGFSATPASNAVSFNGTAAGTPSSASTTRLVVNVPSGASTGKIAVTVGGNTATSSADFVVGAGNGPLISSVSPTTGAAGTPVTISGSNFQAALLDKVNFNQSLAQIGTASASSITTTVPTSATSGKITVTTPYGSATSPSDFIVPPPGYCCVGTSGRIPTNGSPTPVSLPTANTIGVELFDGSVGQYFTIGISGNTFASATIKVFNPNGTLLTSTTIPGVAALKLPQLKQTGTYSIVVDPGANTGSVTLTVVSALTGTLTVDGSSLPLTLSAGRRALISFAGTGGQAVTLAASGANFSSSVSILNPDGTTLATIAVSTAATYKPILPYDGNYTVFVDPVGAAGGNITLALATTAMPPLNTSQTNYTLTLNGTAITNTTFNALAGQYISLAVQENFSTIPSATVIVYGPDTVTKIKSSKLTASNNSGYWGGLVLNMGPIAQSGTYTVQIQQTGTSTGSLVLTLSTPLEISLPTTGVASTATISRPGQPILASFFGSFGQSLGLSIKKTSGGILDETIKLFTPEGTTVATSQFWPDSFPTYVNGITVNAPPAGGGTYTALLQQQAPNTGPLALSASAAITGTINVGSAIPPTNFALSQSGQGAVIAVPGFTGISETITVEGVLSNVPTGTVSVISSSGAVLGSGTFGSTYCNGCLPDDGYSFKAIVTTSAMPANGTYYILFGQTSVGSGNISVGAQ